MKKEYTVLTCIMLLVECLCGCGGKSDDNSIIGKWTVMAYELNGEKVSKDEVSDYMGEAFSTIERPTLLFQESGLARIYMESGELDETVNYTVTDNVIELYKEDEHGMYLDIDGNTIKVETDSENIVLIYTKE